MNTQNPQDLAALAPLPCSAHSPLLARERILDALSAALTQEGINAAADEIVNTGTPAEVIGMLAILASLRDSRMEAGDEAEYDGFTGDTERDEADRYERVRGGMRAEWE